MRDLLMNRHVLIVLDDVRTPERIRMLIPSSSSVNLLLTTRDHDIALALNALPIKVEQLNEGDSCHLLEMILGQTRVTAEADVVESISELLQHYPLALEITAKLLARAGSQSLGDMLKQLQDANERLNRLHFKDLSVRLSFEVSWAVLTKELRRAFTHISLWEGRSFSIPAIGYLLQQVENETAEQLLNLVSLSCSRSGRMDDLVNILYWQILGANGLSNPNKRYISRPSITCICLKRVKMSLARAGLTMLYLHCMRWLSSSKVTWWFVWHWHCCRLGCDWHVTVMLEGAWLGVLLRPKNLNKQKMWLDF